MRAGVTVYQRFGSWYWRFWNRATRPRSPYEKGGYKTWREAHDEGWKKRREVEQPPEQRGAELALADYAERWLTERADLAPITLESYAERLRGHVLPELGRLRLAAVTPGHVRRFLEAKRRDGHSKNGVRLMKAALSSLLTDAVTDELIPSNACLQVRGRTRRAQTVTQQERQQNIRPMALEQRESLLAAARKHRPEYVLLFELLAKGGLRPSEAYALRSEDLDAAGGRVHVERAWVRNRPKATKTSATRWVELPDGLVERLGQRRGLLFTAPEGGHLDPSKVGKAFRTALRKAKLAHFRLYDLRHTYACLRLAAGAPVTYVAAQLGHATPATTLRFYARWIPSVTRQWVEQEAPPASRRGDRRGGPRRLRAVSR